MHRLLAHDIKEWFGFFKACGITADHKGQRASRSTPDAARDRRVKGQQACGLCIRGDRAGAVHIDGGAIDKDRAFCHGGDDIGRDGA